MCECDQWPPINHKIIDNGKIQMIVVVVFERDSDSIQRFSIFKSICLQSKMQISPHKMGK